MKAKRFSEEQIIGVLKEAEAEAKTKDLCRQHGISEATFYKLPCYSPIGERSAVPTERGIDRPLSALQQLSWAVAAG